MKKYIVANWKMAPTTLAEAEDILAYIDEYLQQSSEALAKEEKLSLVICPPFVFLDDVGKILSTSRLVERAELGAQDIALADSGAWTGEVSGPMLKRLGVKYVIIGHSERRWKLGESDEVVNKKLKTALINNLIPIVCIGEKTKELSAEGGSVSGGKEFLEKQIEATFAGLSADDISRCFIAYEPVWAISSNPDSRPDTPESALESIKIIQEVLTVNCKLETINLPLFLYGGSVTSSNVKDFISLNEISGVLVGGASVKKEEFIEIIKNS